MAKDDQQSRGWRSINVDLGLLTAVAVLLTTAFMGGVGLPLWMDQRIDDRVDTRVTPIERKVDLLEARIESMEHDSH